MSEYRFIRGGSWDSFWDELRVPDGLRLHKLAIDYAIGFRIVQDESDMIVFGGAFGVPEESVDISRMGLGELNERLFELGFRVVRDA